MKVGAYQFAVTNQIEENWNKMKDAILQASEKEVRLLVFPECAWTGYPPHDFEKSSMVDFDALSCCYKQIRRLAADNDMYIVAGTITAENGKYYNSAMLFAPDEQRAVYHKRALWGWDKDNFCVGSEKGVFEVDGFKIGMRICFEVRFPELFRELYAEQTDLNVILFYDVSDYNDLERYELITSHIRTRAVENVCHTLSVDAIRPYQTAPTALYDKSGRVVGELDRNTEGLLVCDWNEGKVGFGEQGIKQITDSLLQM